MKPTKKARRFLSRHHGAVSAQQQQMKTDRIKAMMRPRKMPTKKPSRPERKRMSGLSVWAGMGGFGASGS